MHRTQCTILIFLLLLVYPCGAETVWTEGEDTWAFSYPDPDPFGDAAWLDLRRLNEAQSGQHGFVRLSKDGSGFVRGDGQPIRFWSVSSYGFRHAPDVMDYQARFLAKIGINMARLHLNIPNYNGQIDDVNTGEIEQVWRYIKACKDNGIYLTISPYWGNAGVPQKWKAELPGGGNLFGLVFFNPRLQEAYKKWLRVFYTKVNPHTGLPIARDPSVAILQAQNEDSLLYWTSQKLPAQQVAILGRQYHDWLVAHHGSIAAAYAHWNGERVGTEGSMGSLADDPDRGFMGLFIVWHMTQPPQPGGRARRLADQLRFIAETQRNFYRDIAKFCREELGCRQIFNASNWKTADNVRLYDAERWSYAANEVQAVNAYMGGVHQGANTGYRIDPGDLIAHRSVLREPLHLPTNLRQVAGAPMLITESSWVRPNLYQSEGALLTAAYSALTGVDSLYWFGHGERDYQRDPRQRHWHVKRDRDTGYALNMWTVADPAQQGMFPASALLFRRGDVAQGKPVVDEHRSLAAVWNREAPVISETATFDPNRDAENLTYAGGVDLDVSRLAFLVGPVQVTYDSDPARTRIADLAPFIDGKRQVVRANTGELALDWKRGVFTLDAPRAKAVAGFLKAAGGQFELNGLAIASSNEYATVQVVSFDDLPLRQSRRVLVQVGTAAQLSGWTTRPAKVKVDNRDLDGEEILYTGKPPWLVRNTHVSLSLENPHLNAATLLDAAGYPRKSVPVERTGDRLRVTLPHDTLYLMLHVANP
ncbi:MAG: hypothetical protein WCI17_03085 [bacterium]